MIGSTVSHFKILSKLGEGGMGVVYKAHDTRLGRIVALKFLPRQSGSTREERRRFVNEAKAASALDHPHICNIHDVDETDDGQMFIVMGFYEGETLDQRIAKGPLPVTDIVDLAIQATEGLQAAHAKGIVHRDIKSSNLIVTPEGQLKVMDFGLAKSSSVSFVTQKGVAVGTVPFMSPEQARGEKVDKRTDIWSLGAVMYHMIAGRLPFTGDYAEALVYLILNEAPPPLRSLRKDAPEELVAIVTKCLQKDPTQRYRDMNELLAELYRLKGTPAGLRISWSLRKTNVLAPRVLVPVAVVIIAIVVALFVPQTSVDANAAIGSIAVLPLENLSGDPAKDYLAAGLHEALITDLSKLSGLKRVIARASVKRFRNTTLPPSEICRELAVDAIVTASVLQAGNHVQVTAHVIRASSEDPMWSERFDREFKDIFSLQHDIIGTLAREIQLRLTPQERTNLQSAQTVNPDAYEAYLKGRFENDKQTPEGFDRAEEYFLKAIEIEPDYGLAYAGLAFTWMSRGDTGYEPPSETFPKGRELIDKALELDSTSAEARFTWATFKANLDWEWAEAEEAFREAISLNPNMADAHFFLADLLIVLGRESEWEKEINLALQLDPLNDFNRSFYGWHLNYVGRYDEAIPIFLELREAGPNKASSHLGLWGAYFMKNSYAEAASSARDYFNEIGDSEFADAIGSPGDRDGYREAMRRTGELMALRSRQTHVPATRIARMFAHAGENERALDWLEKAYEAHESTMMRLKVFWDWERLRQEERYKQLLRKVGLELRAGLE